ncbi:MAG TPA: 30S ribosomal protein S1 [Bacteroidales bacterium]|nr:30S ribosomal protein S1 [Bacteroidales bacterium]
MTDETNLNDQENVQENQEQQDNQVETNVEAEAQETPVAETETNEVVEKTEAEAQETPVAETETNEVVEKTEAEEQVETPVAEAEKVAEKPKRVVKTVDENFNWENIGKKHDTYSGDERKKLEDIYDKTLSSIVEQQVVDGTIVGMNSREVVVNIGFKSDAVVSLNEFRDIPDLKIGDKVDVYVESQENLTGQLILSHKKAKLLKAWDRVNEALEKDEIITGFVKCRTKGGLIVDVFGIEAFLPGSQIDVKPIRDYDVFVGKNMEFKVVKVNNEFKNVVVSHKALIEDELEQQKSQIIAKLEKGQVLEGIVKNITSYGVFIDLGGVDGLIHITDLSWGRISHPEEIVTLDEKIQVVILDFDEGKKRIALGLKQLTPHPWESLDANLKVGDKVKGKVVVIADYGAFIEIAKGVEGLIHVSEMSWSQHLRTAHDFLKVNDEIEAIILTLDREERKMSLGIKQLIPDPWTNIGERYPVNSKHEAIVRNFTNFGIFVELEEGVDGLIHISDLSWSKKIKHPAEFTKIGEKIEVVVLEVDTENRRLSLGHKQLEENPWDIFETVFTVDSIHKGTIVSSNDKGAIISLPYGVEGFAPARHLLKEDNTIARTDETLDFKVIEFSKDNKKILVSHTKLWQDAINAEKAKEAADQKNKETTAKKVVKKIKDNLEKTTLGDIEALANLKSDMEQNEREIFDKKYKEKISKKEAKKAEEKIVEEENITEEVKKVEDIKKDEPTPDNAEENKEDKKQVDGEINFGE